MQTLMTVNDLQVQSAFAYLFLRISVLLQLLLQSSHLFARFLQLCKKHTHLKVRNLVDYFLKEQQ